MTNIDIWIWLNVPLFLIGLCLSLYFGCFTKRNMSAFLAVFVLNYVVLMIVLLFLPRQTEEHIFLYRNIIITFLMLCDFYIIRKKTPIKEALSFTLFTATAFPITDKLVLIILSFLGFLR